MPAPVVFGCGGAALKDSEHRFFQEADPWGFILFSRNVSDPEGVLRLTGELRSCVGREALVFVDQEGGSVARLRPPHWKEWPAVGPFLAQVEGGEAERHAALDRRFRDVARELLAAGIDANCMPVLDIPAPGTSPVIGDRALGADPSLVAGRGRAVCEALLAEGVLPVVKHMPGHGRATVDSHDEMPVVDALLEDLDARDFAPFRDLADMPIAMTAHIAYTAVDPDVPATLSRRMVEDVMRGNLGFDGVILSDDLCMGAIRGPLRESTAQAIEAGCDVALHCDGEMAAMEEVMEGVGTASPEALRRMADAEARRNAAQGAGNA